jgi:tape measure domain-containing protein
MDLAQLKFVVDTTQLKEASDVIQKLGKDVEALNKPMDKLATSSKKAAEATKTVGTGAEQSAAKVKKLSQSTTEATSPIEALQAKLSNTFKDLAQGFTRGESSVLNLARAMGASEKELNSIKKILGDIGKLVKDPFDSAIGSVRSINKEFDLLQQRASLAQQGIALSNKQLREYSRIADEVAGKVKASGLDPTQGQGLAMYSKMLTEQQSKYLATAKSVNSLNEAEKNRNKALLAQQSIEKANIGVGDQMVNMYKRRQSAIDGEIRKLKEQAAAMRAGQGAVTGNMVNRLTGLGASTQQIEQAKLLRREIEAMGKAARASERPMMGLQGIIRGLIPAFGALSATAIAATGIRKFFEIADDVQLLSNRIKILSDNTVEFEPAFQNLTRIANEARVPIKETGLLYARLIPVMKSTGKTAGDAAIITEAFSKAMLVSGTNAQEARSGLTQFSQAMASGKLAGDEFRSISEAVPEVLRIMEKQLGVTRAEIRKMASDGKLTSDVLSNALINSLDDLNRKLNDTPKTVGQAFTLLGNQLTVLSKQFNDTFKVTQSMSDMIMSFSSLFKIMSENKEITMTVIGVLAGAGTAAGLTKVGLMIKGVAGAMFGIGSAVAIISNMLGASPSTALLLGLGTAATIKFGAVIAGISATTTSLVGMSAAFRAATVASLGFFATPMGLLILGGAAIGGGIYAFIKAQDTLAEKMAKVRNEMEKAGEIKNIDEQRVKEQELNKEKQKSIELALNRIGVLEKMNKLDINTLAYSEATDNSVSKQIQKRKKEIAELRAEVALLQNQGLDTRAEDAKFARQNAVLVQADSDRKLIDELRKRYSGLRGDVEEYTKALEALQRNRSTMGDKEYIRLVTELAKQYGVATTARKKLTEADKEAKESTKLMGDLLDRNAGFNADFTEKTKLLEIAMKSKKYTIEEINLAWAALLKQQPIIKDALKEQAEAFEAARKVAAEYGKQLDDIALADYDIEIMIKKSKEDTQERQARLELDKSTFGMSERDAALTRGQYEINKKLQEDILAIKMKGGSADVTNQAIQEAQAIADQNTQLLIMEENLKRVQQEADRMANLFGDAFKDLISGGKSFGDVLKDLTKGIMDMAVEIMILEPLKASMRGMFAGAGGFGGVFGSIFSGLGFADGGVPPMNKVSVVGERGPELFVPHTAGTIIPNDKLGGNTNQVVQNITVNVSTPTGNLSRESLQQIQTSLGAATQRALRRNS